MGPLPCSPAGWCGRRAAAGAMPGVCAGPAGHVLAREPAPLGHALGEVLRADGIELILGVTATAARRDGPDYVLTLEDGRELRGDHLLAATGRRPRLPAGLDTAGVTAGPHGITVDAHLRAGERLWAVARLGRASGMRLLFRNTAWPPEHPFPAALDEGLAAWRWLRTDQNLNERSIAVAGNSAGGGLAVALLVGTREAGQALPAAAALMSRTGDLTSSGASIPRGSRGH